MVIRDSESTPFCSIWMAREGWERVMCIPVPGLERCCTNCDKEMGSMEHCLDKIWRDIPIRSCSMVVLPAEIFNIIFSLIDDQHSLANLALASFLFLQCSRPYYFRSIIITAENVTKLADLLTNPYQTISGRIRELHLIDAPFNDDGPPPKGLFEREDILILVASTIGPTATSMFLDCIDLVSFHPRMYQQFLSGFPNLLSIELDSVSFASVSQVLYMFGNFHSLESASLNNIGWGSPTNDTPDNVYDYEIPPSLRKLCLWGCYKRDVMKCFLSQKVLPIIRELDLGLISPSDTEAIGEYIGRLGKDLGSLSLGFSSLDAGGDAGKWSIWGEWVSLTPPSNRGFLFELWLKSKHPIGIYTLWPTPLFCRIPIDQSLAMDLEDYILNTLNGTYDDLFLDLSPS